MARCRHCHDLRMGALDAISWPAHTNRLMLRPATLSDACATWRFRRLADVTHWLTTAPATFEEHRERLEDGDRLAATVIFELGGEVIGDLLVRIDDSWAQAEIAEQARGVQAELGWVLHPDHAGRGYATEAVRELLRICFEDLKLRRITGHCFAENNASRRLFERVGMRRETYTVRDSLHRSGEWLDGVGYALLSDEWHART